MYEKKLSRKEKKIKQAQDLDFAERAIIYEIVQKRREAPKSEYISFDDILKKADVSRGESQVYKDVLKRLGK
jgi:hypothetical protein